MSKKEEMAVRRIARRCGASEEQVEKAFKALSFGRRALYRQLIMPHLHPEWMDGEGGEA